MTRREIGFGVFLAAVLVGGGAWLVLVRSPGGDEPERRAAAARAPQGALVVFVTDHRGTPLPGAKVRVREWAAGSEARFLDVDPFEIGEPPAAAAEVVADDAGRAVIAEPPSGELLVFAHADGHAGGRATAGPTGGAPRPPVRLVLSPAFSIAGGVLGADGRPLAGARILAWPLNGFDRTDEPPPTVRTDADGRFLVEGVAEGRHILYMEVGAGSWILAGTVSAPAPNPVHARVPDGVPMAARIVADEDGAPIAGAQVIVRLRDGNDGPALLGRTVRTTGSDGRFSFESVLPGPQDVLIRAAGRVAWEDRNRIYDGPPPEGFFEPRLRRLTAVGGRVVGEDGEPVAHARVHLRDYDRPPFLPPEFETIADEAGRWRIEGVPPEEIRQLSAASSDDRLRWEETFWWIPAEYDEDRERQEIVLLRAAETAGTAVFSDGRPAAGLIARIGDDVVATDAEGRFRFPAVTPGDFTVEVRGPGGELVWHDDGEAAPGAVVSDLRVEVAEGGAITGRIERAAGLLSEAFLTCGVVDLPGWMARRGDARRVAPNAGGEFRIDGLAAGRYLVRAWAPGAAIAAVEVTVAGGEAAAGVTLRLEPEHVLSGIAVDEAGRPVAGARLRAEQKRPGSSLPVEATAISGPDGRFEFRGLSPRPAWIEADAFGHLPAACSTTGGEGDLITTLPRWHHVVGQVVDEDGEPIREIFEIRTEGYQALRTTADGSFELKRATAGRHVVHVRCIDGGFQWATFPDVEFGAAPLRLPVQRGFRISGIVVREDAGDDLLLYATPAGDESGGRRWRAEIEADGSFRTPPLPPGDYDVVLVGDGGAVRASDVPAGTADVRIVARVVPLIRGIVVDEAGKPVSWGVPVEAFPEDAPGGEKPAATDRTDAEGRFRLRLPGTGGWRIRAGGGESPYPPAWAERAFEAGAEDVRIVVRAGARIAGRILGADGRPAAYVHVTAAPAGAEPEWGGRPPTGEDGAFELAGVPPGPVRLWAFHDGRSIDLGPVEAPADGVERRLPE